MKQTALKYGLISGAPMVVLSWANFFLTKELSYRIAEIGGYITIVIALTIVFFGIRHYRDHVKEGIVSFKSALTMGLLISLIPAFFMLVSTTIFMATMGGQWMDWALANMPEAQRTQYESAPPWMFNPIFQGFVMFGTVFVIGVIISAISAFVLKKEPGKG